MILAVSQSHTKLVVGPLCDPEAQLLCSVVLEAAALRSLSSIPGNTGIVAAGFPAAANRCFVGCGQLACPSCACG